MSDTKQKGGLGKIVVIVATIALVFVVANQFGLIDKLKDVEGLQAWFQRLGLIGYIAYILLYILIAIFKIGRASCRERV